MIFLDQRKLQLITFNLGEDERETDEEDQNFVLSSYSYSQEDATRLCCLFDNKMMLTFTFLDDFSLD